MNKRTARGTSKRKHERRSKKAKKEGKGKVSLWGNKKEETRRTNKKRGKNSAVREGIKKNQLKTARRHVTNKDPKGVGSKKRKRVLF